MTNCSHAACALLRCTFEGKLTVLTAAAQGQVLRVNELGEEIRATPALSEGRIYIRTRTALYCFGASQ